MISLNHDRSRRKQANKQRTSILVMTRDLAGCGSRSARGLEKVANGESWRIGWDLTDEERDRFRMISNASREAKARARKEGVQVRPPLCPAFRPEDLMPQRPQNGLAALSLFSGGGGLDVGFERAGFRHIESWDILNEAADTLRRNRPAWKVHGGGVDGDVRTQCWERLRGIVDVVHGGPPCQPFSSAGRQHGPSDARDMFPEFVRAVLEIQPAAFMAENVAALLSSKFKAYLYEKVIRPLSSVYTIIEPTVLRADSFGVPQLRRRVFLIGFKSADAAAAFHWPTPTHSSAPLTEGAPLLPGIGLSSCMGVRAALGLEAKGYDGLAPTIRSALTGPRHTTSILSSVSALREWERLGLWPNGIAPTRDDASRFPTPNGHVRLAVQDVAVIQGFPEDWVFEGATYKSLGQIGNAVPPPLAYQVASAIAETLQRCSRTSLLSHAGRS